MRYLDGGGVDPIYVSTKMLSKSYCWDMAEDYMAATGMSQLRIAMEIYAHAVLYVGGLAAGAVLGLDNKVVADIVNRANPIDLGGDSVKRLAVYSAIWVAPSPIIVV